MPKYTHQTISTYPDSEGSNGYGVQVTAWTDEAWNRAQDAYRKYQEDQEWQRSHPFLAGLRNFGTKALDGVGSFINDEILLNKGGVRTKNYQRALQSNPNFSNDWDMASNIGEFVNVSTGGLLNRLSPTQNLRLIYDGFTGENINPLDPNSSWWGNTGIVSQSFAQDHPYLSFGINGLADGLAFKGMARGHRYLTEPIVKTGAEAEVTTTRLSPYVIKRSTIEPSEMTLRNQVPTFLKTSYLGTDSNGLYMYRQPKVLIPRNPVRTFKAISNKLAQNHYFPFEHQNMEGRGFLNILNNTVLSDFGLTGYGQIGRTLFGKPVIVDMARESIPDFMIAMQKKGGKLNEKG